MHRELLALARRSTLADYEPEQVRKILQNFATSKMSFEQPPYTPAVLIRMAQCRNALMEIWQLARTQYSTDIARRAQWQRVMATCNSLYEQGRGPQAPKDFTSLQAA